MNTKSKGLGDSIAKLTKATGIDKLVHKVMGEDCGCDKRQDALNKLMPYQGAYMCSEDAKTFRDELLPLYRQGQLNKKETKTFIGVYNRTFNSREKPTNCGSCGKELFRKLKQVYDEQYK